VGAEESAVPGARRPPSARAAVIPLRRGGRLPVPRAPRLSRFAPSTRSLLVGLALLAGAAGVYLAARETSMFAIRTVEIRGATPSTAAAVRKALEPLAGTSLVALGGDAVARRADAVPTVISASYDRAFPHTLRVTIREERPVAVVRRGNDSFLVSARGRVIRLLVPHTFGQLPRIWVPRTTGLTVGETLGGEIGSAAAAVAPLARLHFPIRVVTASAANGRLTLQLRSGLELRLGSRGNLFLKLSVAKQIAPTIPPGTGTYLDVSVPDRAVAGGGTPPAASPTNPQVAGGG
jgi:cell division protein FtsQ